MYPHSELTRLAAAKVTLRRDIARRRHQCAAAAAAIARPLAWVDRAAAFWQKITPFAGLATVPLGLLLERAVFPRAKLLGTLLRWGPAALRAMRNLTRRPAGPFKSSP